MYYRVDQGELERFTQQVFAACDLKDKHARMLADNLVQGELHGLGSHGVSRLMPVYVQRLQAGGMNPAPEIRVLRRNHTLALVDGDAGPGAVVGNHAMRMALDMCSEHGSGFVGVRNSSHFGAAFLYARQALDRGMIGFASTAAVPMVLPYGGRKPALGTNPICVAVPGGDRGNIILDMATSVVARGKVQVAVLEGKDIPEGWAVDPEGNPTTSAQEATRGYMLPLGGYKGTGLAIIAEVFSSVLTGAAITTGIGGLFVDHDKPQQMGHFFGALDIEGFAPIDAFRARIDDLIRSIKATPLADGVDVILMPGEPEARKAAENRSRGIPLAENVVTALNEVAESLNMAPLAVTQEA